MTASLTVLATLTVVFGFYRLSLTPQLFDFSCSALDWVLVFVVDLFY